MMVSPDAISARSAPEASPLNSCETKLGQVIICAGREAGGGAAAAAAGPPRRRVSQV